MEVKSKKLSNAKIWSFIIAIFLTILVMSYLLDNRENNVKGDFVVDISENTLKPGNEAENKDLSEGIDTTLNNSINDSADKVSYAVDENGVPIEKSTYLDSDGDTVPNSMDICPSFNDFDENCKEKTG